MADRRPARAAARPPSPAGKGSASENSPSTGSDRPAPSAKPMPGTLRISSIRGIAAADSILRPSSNSPSGLSGHGSAVRRYSSRSTPQTAWQLAPSRRPRALPQAVAHANAIDRVATRSTNACYGFGRLCLTEQHAVNAAGQDSGGTARRCSARSRRRCPPPALRRSRWACDGRCCRSAVHQPAQVFV